MIIGVPNVGKSAILNRLAGKRKQDVKNTPGVTKELKKVNISDKIQITDTPGVLWHKFEDPFVGEKLAILGSVKDSILYRDDIALKAIELLKELYPARLSERYKIDLTEIEEKTPTEIFDAVGKKRGCLVSCGRVDNDKTARILLTDIREGRLGGICLESP
jgi:ribosome biogenesis GTPase A